MSAVRPLPSLDLAHAGTPPAPPHRQRARVAVLVAVLVVVGGWPLAQDLTTRPIRAVRVTGEFRRVPRADLEQAVAGQVVGVRLLGVEVSSVQRAAQTLPWVRAVTVRRVWPDSVHIAVEEREAAVRWNADALLEWDGAMFAPPSLAGTEALAHLEGPAGRQEQVLEQYRAFSGALARGPFGEIEALRLEPRGGWRVRMASGAELVLGHGQGVEELVRLVAAIRQIEGGQIDAVERIDLRYANGFAVRMAPAAPSEEAPTEHGDGASG